MQPTNMMTVAQNDGGGELSLSRPPETILREAEMVAAPWSKKVESLQLYKTISDKKHLYIEAWQMMGAMFRVTARIRETRYVEFGEVKGWEATAEAFHIPTGQVISTADGMCLSEEEKWGPRTKYRDNWVTDEATGKRKNDRIADGFVSTPLQQLRSMAQTRACSKVLSNLFKWVAVMKGYQGTPAEEMSGEEGGEPKTQGPSRKSAAAPQQQNGVSEAMISEPQAKRMYAIAMGAKLSKDDFMKYLKDKGFEGSREIPRDKYDVMITELEAMGKAANQ